jgi:hypothetical protein
MEADRLKFPIGRCPNTKAASEIEIETWISEIEIFPAQLAIRTAGLTTTQLDLKYRTNGWTIAEVINHCADSHMNSFIRFKLTLTEDQPTIKPYFEDRWANGSDYSNDSVSDSLLILKGLHTRWAKLLRSLDTTQLERTFIHPEHGTEVSIVENIGIYAWHCKHHLAHIEEALAR